MSEEIKITDLVQLFIKRSWIIFICMFIVGGAVFICNDHFIDPVYVSKGLLYVNNVNSLNISLQPAKNMNLSDIAASQKLATTYIEILKSDTYMRIVNEKSGVNYSPAKMRSKVSLESKNDTEILEITAMDISPENATSIANAMLSNAKDEILRVMKGGSVEIIDNASIPKKPSGPNIPRNTIIGVIMGSIFGLAIIFLTDLFDSRIKDQDELSNKYKYPVLGLIPNFQSDRDSSYGSPNSNSKIKEKTYNKSF